MEVPTVKFNEKSHIRRGKKCIHCGCDQWYKKNSVNCVVCAKVQRIRNKDTIAATKRACKANNPDADKQYRDANKEKLAAGKAKWHVDNSDHVKKRVKKYNDANRDRNRKRSKKNYDKNSLAYKKRSAARKRGYDYDDVTPAQHRALKLRQPLCKYCGEKADTDDHILPLKRGGKHKITNLQRLCRSCNSSKGAKTEEEFQQWLALVANR